MSEVKLSDVDLGRLIQAVETLTSEVTALNSRVRELETQLAKGKGLFSGVVLVSGACGALIAAVLNKWL
jgi:ribulose kinase